MAREFDVIVIGAGPAGEVIAGRLADAGKAVAVVERELVGGECSFWACMPSKALLRPAELRAELPRVPGAAPELGDGGVDAATILRRRDEVIHDLDDSAQLPWLEDKGIALVRSSGVLAGERRVRAGEEELVARDAVVLASGSGALIPPIPGLREAKPWSNREITTAKRVPGRLLILGGGVVGVEMASAWRSLGSEVVLVEAMDRLLGREEPFAAELIQHALEESGVEVVLGSKAVSVSREDEVRLELEDGRSFAGDEIVVAIGRRPHVADLGLEALGLPADGYVEVDDHLRVAGRDWLYCIGDLNGRALLTHAGKYQARIAADNILGTDAALRVPGPATPRVIFTDPQVAAVGITAQAAQDDGHEVEVIDLDTSASAGASFVGRGTAGTCRFVVDRRREVLLGATFVGFEVAEWLHAASLAVVGELPMATIAHAIPAFPTRSEIWLQFVEAYERRRGGSLHIAAAAAPPAADAART